MSVELDERRRLWQAAPARALLLSGLIPAEVAARLRQAVRPKLVPYYVADRGRYQVDEGHVDEDLFFGLAALATEIAQVPARPVRARWTRLAHRDYALHKNDSRLWRGMDRHLEVVLDFSERQSDEAQIIWSAGSEVFWMPQWPLTGALVDRRQPIQRYDRYLTHRVGDAEVFRLSLALEVG